MMEDNVKTLEEAPVAVKVLSGEDDVTATSSIKPSSIGRRFLRQTKALLLKNFYEAKHNKVSSFAQLFTGVFFLFFLWLTNEAIKANDFSSGSSETQARSNIGIGDFQFCMSDTAECLDFIYTIDSTSYVVNQTDRDIADTIAAGVGAYLGTTKFEYRNSSSVDTYLLANQNMTKLAVTFRNTRMWEINGMLEYVVQLNETFSCGDLNILDCDSPTQEYDIPFRLAVDTVLLREYGGLPNAEIKADFADFPHPDLPNNNDAVSDFGSTFLFVAVTFNFIIQLSNLAQEKELKLVEALRQVGMLDSAYWMSWIISNCLINILATFVIIGFGALLSLELFLENSFAVTFIFFWLSSMSFTAFAFLITAVSKSASTARLFGVMTFITGFIAGPIINSVIYANPDSTYDVWRVILAFLPPTAFFNVIGVLISKSSGATNKGFQWVDLQVNTLPASAEFDTFWSVGDALRFITASFFVFTLLASYLDKVLPDVNGYRLPVYYMFTKGYWFGSAGSNKGAVLKKVNNNKKDNSGLDEDVKAEADTVLSQSYPGSVVPPVELFSLRKTFGSFTAVNDIAYSINNDELFVLLGHNGAGKTTTFNMLTGLTIPSGGDAWMFGQSIKASMDKIRPIMGVCPQHDVLWEGLSPTQHLRLFSTIKGLTNEEIQMEVAARLGDVKLTGVAHQPSGEFSGGMKRRLSISLALIGNPKIVFLDEPTTGMDPVSRRDVWDMISRSKRGRVIVLTTHSMEEADILGDRIGVMSHGKMQALGTSLRLKAKFGSGYRLTVSTSAQDEFSNFIKSNAPEGTKLASVVQENMLFQLPRGVASDELISFFKLFETQRAELSVDDFALSLTTLEEVFLNLSNDDAFITTDELISREVVAISDEKKEDVGARKVPTTGDYVAALAYKTWHYQRRSWGTCCSLVCFPALVVIGITLLSGLFEVLKLEILCGTGVAKEDCLDEGPNIDCLQSFFEATFESELVIDHGTINEETGAPFDGVNPNCNSNGCFDDLEQINFTALPVSVTSGDAAAVGSLGYTSVNMDELIEWVANSKLDLLLIDSCQAVYEEAFDTAQCDGSAAPAACQENVRDLVAAREYLETQQGGGSSQSGLALCSASGATVVPAQNILDQVVALQAEREECYSLAFPELFATLGDTDALNVQAELTAITGSKSGSGILGQYSTKQISDPLLDAAVSRVFLQTEAVFEFFVQGQFTFNALNGITQTADEVVVTLVQASSEELCVIYDLLLSVLSPNQTGFNDTITAAVSDATHPNNRRGVDNLCFAVSNLDAMRMLSTAATTSLDSDLFAAWYGTEYQSQYMADYDFPTTNLQYLERQYYSPWTALDFTVADAATGEYAYTALYNATGTASSADGGRGSGNWKSAMMLMDSAILMEHTGNTMNVKAKTFPGVFSCNRDEWLAGEVDQLDCPSLLPGFLNLSIVDFIGSSLFPILLLLHMFFIPLLIVYEKRKKLLILMKMMGLPGNVYWVINYFLYVGQVILLFLFLYLTGVFVAGAGFFTRNDPIVVWLYFLTWANTLVMFAFLLTVFFSNESTAVAVSLVAVLLIITSGRTLLDNLLLDANTPSESYAPLMILPPLTMIRGLLLFAYAGAFQDNITTENWATFYDGTILECIGIMWLQWFICLLLLWYLDKVFVAGFGTREKPFFFLKKQYWRPDRVAPEENLGAIGYASSVNPSELENGEDIVKEYERVIDPNNKTSSVKIVRLNKTFSNGKVAVKSLSLGVEDKECFGLLGHNGAGKSTAINMLCGLFEPTQGDALVEGLSIKRAMHQIQAFMGVCNQDNILWDTLSVSDHLRFFGRLKGLRGKKLHQAVSVALREVNLEYAKNRASKKLSGGMKRRLSVAMSLIGNPKVVYLDEPSTGLDPASRRQLWDVISRAKGNKSIVLTTHSMEEADVLCSRVGIMALGELQCVGTSIDLKRRYGKGYTLQVTAERTQESYKQIEEFATKLFPSATLINVPLGGTSKFEVAREEVLLSKVFEEIEAAKGDLGITDWGLTETTLEEVFIKLANKAHVDEQLLSL